MTRHAACLFAALCLCGTAFAGNDDLDIDKVNGSIHVPDNATVGKLSTVNGGIRIGANAHARGAETVNGGIELDSGAQVGSLETVNGGIRVGDKSRIAETIEAVNGSITLHDGAEVVGKASNVNGSIKLENARVGGGIETTSGDITVGANSQVKGGILVNEDHSWFRVSSSHKPHIEIGPHAVVQGTLTFKREVELYVSDSATVGKIEGATAKKFSGEQP